MTSEPTYSLRTGPDPSRVIEKIIFRLGLMAFSESVPPQMSFQVLLNSKAVKVDFPFPVFLPKIVIFSPKKDRKFSVKNRKSINRLCSDTKLESYIMVQNFERIVCTSSELSHWCQVSLDITLSWKKTRRQVILSI